jgi:hypothetical protein
MVRHRSGRKRDRTHDHQQGSQHGQRCHTGRRFLEGDADDERGSAC